LRIEELKFEDQYQYQVVVGFSCAFI